MSGAEPSAPADEEAPKQLSVVGAAFLGVGAMVGAGIFALLGQAGMVAGSAVWISFLLAGVIAALLGYVVVKLGVRYPSKGGFVAYLVEAFGNGRLVGITSWLLYFVLLIVTSMVAVSFGAYGSSLFFGDDAAGYWDNVLASLIVVAMAIVNLFGAAIVAKAQSAIVWVLLVVFAGFAIATLVSLDPDLLAPSTYPLVEQDRRRGRAHLLRLPRLLGDHLHRGGHARPGPYAAAGDVLALGITIVLYVAVSLGVFGTLTVDEVIENGDTALAEAARPVFGDAGFVIMAVAALLATASSVNSNIFAAGNLTLSLSQLAQFPPVFGQPGRFRGTRGVTITVAGVLVLVNSFDLSAIASLGSAVSLIVFLVVGLAGCVCGRRRARARP